MRFYLFITTYFFNFGFLSGRSITQVTVQCECERLYNYGWTGRPGRISILLAASGRFYLSCARAGGWFWHQLHGIGIGMEDGHGCNGDCKGKNGMDKSLLFFARLGLYE